MLTKEQAQALTKKAIGFTSFPECAVQISSSEDAFIRFALNGVTTSGFVATNSMFISVTKDKQTGSTGVDEFDDKSIQDAVQRAEQLAKLSPPNPEGMPPIGPQKYAATENFVDTTARARNPVIVPH